MTDYRSNTTFEEVARKLLAAQRILITTHAKPDGDAMGACLALARALERKGKAARIFVAGPIERALTVLAPPTPYALIEREQPSDDYDAAVVVDTGAWSQLEQIKPWLQKHHAKVIGIDHHPRGDCDVAALRIVEPSAVSTTALLVPLLETMGFDFRRGGSELAGIAEALFTGLATDSGWFRYPNANADAFALAANLLRCGVDKPRLYQILEESYSPSRLAMEGRALASLTYARDGAIAITMLTPRDFADTGAAVEELTGVVNLPLIVGAVRVSILLSQEKPGEVTKMSFRSKPAPPGAPANQFVDVNALAAKFGGGGHVHAAGAKVKKDLAAVKTDLLATLERM